MEIFKKLDLTDDSVHSLEMHSFINILTLMYNQMFIAQQEAEYPDIFEEPMELVYDLAEGVKTRDRSKFNPGKLRDCKKTIEHLFKQVEHLKPRLKSDPDHLEQKAVFSEILRVLAARLDDMLMRWTDPMKWVVYWVDDFKERFLHYFYALEKNKAGHYTVIYDIAKHHEKDYKVDFYVRSVLVSSITIPVLFKDVMRDIVANARKFTPPGGRINVRLEMSRKSLEFEVADTGIGIPEDEIEDVVKYRYRASNVAGKPEYLGNGFGLTKAYYNVHKLGGSMKITSRLGHGTKVLIEIPVPDREYVNAEFGAL